MDRRCLAQLIAFILVVAIVIALTACGDSDGATGPTVVLQPDEEAWWCESLTEARAWGMNPADYADLMREAFETGQHNAPVSNLEDAATQLASVSCDVEYARAAATLLGWGN